MKDIIQIAGIIDRREAQLLLNAGVDWLGFPLRLPVRRENISDDAAAEIIASIQPPAAGWWKYLPNRLCWQGGLNPQNVRQAILQVRPAGVDAHTGVENAAGKKDRGRVAAFVAEARTGFEDIK